jgi:alkanesulfonate monooxygenase SsuD/methylene tetrahydromethanopterin reductase-like flavin-dependent oxidoreductase (luciferase family)
LVIGGNGKRALRVVAEHADVWVSDIPWTTVEETLEKIRGCNHLLDEYCRAINRDPVSVERACIVGWSPAGSPFASHGAFQDFVGRYRDAGVQRFVFSFGSAATPAPYDGWIAAGRWATRATLDAFAAQEMTALQSQGR